MTLKVKVGEREVSIECDKVKVSPPLPTHSGEREHLYDTITITLVNARVKP